jgi:hypothetical protein
MATNMYRKYTERKVETWRVAAGTKSGDGVVHPTSSRFGIALSSRGDDTSGVQDLPDGTQRTGIPTGGIGNRPNTTSVATDGSWFLAVVGVTAGETTDATGSVTKEGTPVYRVTADGTYNLSATGAVKIGEVDSGRIRGTRTPVKIGV